NGRPHGRGAAVLALPPRLYAPGERAVEALPVHEAAQENHRRVPAQQRADHHQRHGVGAGDPVYAAGGGRGSRDVCDGLSVSVPRRGGAYARQPRHSARHQEEADADQRRALVQAVSRARLTTTAGYALALVALTNTMSLLDRNILAILAPRIKHDIGIGDAEMGLFYALFSLPIGRLADGWVRTRLLGITLAFWSVATAVAAAAQGFALLAVSRLGVGIGEGSAQPAGISLVMDHYAKPRRGFAMAVIAAAIALGLGGSSVLGGVAADWWDHLHAGGVAPLGLKGWQFAFLVAAAPGFILAALLWRMPEPRRGRL